MKRMLLSMLMSLLMSAVAFGQQEVTQFLGIPVDGSKSEMIKKLKAKGFKPHPLRTEVLVGQFNGENVNVYIVTNNDKVWRIMVCDADARGETSIKIRFNQLCRQFQSNKKYIPAFSMNYELPDDEDVSYEITVHDKRYEAAFLQLPSDATPEVIWKVIEPSLTSKYTVEQLANPTDEIEKDINETIFKYLCQQSAERSVWFMISSLYGQYYITMYYDNEYNRANGEDL